MAGYIYRGNHTGLDLFDATEPRRIGDKKPCGTNAAYKRHVSHGERACTDCEEASKAYQRERYELRGRKPWMSASK